MQDSNTQPTSGEAGFAKSLHCLRGHLNRSEIAVFGAYAYYAHFNGYSTASTETLAQYAMCSERTVNRANKRLQEAGLITLKAMGRKDGTKGRGSNFVTINWGHEWLAPVFEAEVQKLTQEQERKERQALRKQAMSQYEAQGLVNPETYARRFVTLVQEGFSAEVVGAVMSTAATDATLDDVRSLCRLEQDLAGATNG